MNILEFLNSILGSGTDFVENNPEVQAMLHSDWYGFIIIGVILSIGAVIGALLQAVISGYRSIKPIINTRIDVLAKFNPLFESYLLDTYKIVVTDGAKQYEYNLLAQVEILLTNKSLQDFPE
ncbi:MAG TPA: hypothetical protein VIQ31_15305, partial [Phormidium sp.]